MDQGLKSTITPKSLVGSGFWIGELRGCDEYKTFAFEASGAQILNFNIYKLQYSIYAYISSELTSFFVGLLFKIRA